ncbi:unnamed protein product, partial [Symbiodinium pilosum]
MLNQRGRRKNLLRRSSPPDLEKQWEAFCHIYAEICKGFGMERSAVLERLQALYTSNEGHRSKCFQRWESTRMAREERACLLQRSRRTLLRPLRSPLHERFALAREDPHRPLRPPLHERWALAREDPHRLQKQLQGRQKRLQRILEKLRRLLRLWRVRLDQEDGRRHKRFARTAQKSEARAGRYQEKDSRRRPHQEGLETDRWWRERRQNSKLGRDMFMEDFLGPAAKR